MARVSKEPLEPAVQKNVDAAFVKFFASCRDKKTVARIFNELLGSEEKIMLSKRLAAIIMIGNGHSSYEVRETLNVGAGTESRLRTQLDNESMPTLEKMLCSSKRKEKEIDTGRLIELLMYAGMPPFEGKGRRRWQQRMRSHRTN